jgi:HAD superfamily hydrolase (TIGR01549 family)
LIKHIIWDFDGTLFDTYPPIAHAMQSGLQQHGFDFSYEELYALCKVSMSHCMQAISKRTTLSFAEVEEEFDHQIALLGPETQIPFAGVEAVLNKVVALGGKNIIITHRHSASLEKLLEHFHLKDYFSGWLTADDGFPRKPDPAAFFAALQSYHLNPAETLGIGDRALDIEASRSAGLRTAFYGDPPQDLQVDYVIREYKDFLTQLA